MRLVLFGEVLFDEFPDGTAVLGGAPFNVAWNLRGFGLDPLLISRVGDDTRGRAIIDAMERWSLDTRGLQIDPHRPTGVVDIRLDGMGHRFEIRQDQAYDHIDAERALTVCRDIESGVVYHGSLALRQADSRAALEAVAGVMDQSFFDVNLRDPWWTANDLQRDLERADQVKVNDEELARLAALLDVPGSALDDSASALRKRFNLSLLVVTRGPAGARAWTGDGPPIDVGPAEPVQVVDTIGAGDAFCSGVLYGLHCGRPTAATLAQAQQFAGAVCALRGATSADPDFYRPSR